MKAPRRLPSDFMVKIPKEKSGYEDQIGSSVLTSILESRIGQMTAITLPTEENKIQILNQINDLQSNSEKMSSFLDFMVNEVTSLSFDYYNAKEELAKLLKQNAHETSKFSSFEISDSDDEDDELSARIKSIAKKLNVQPNKIERRITDLVQLKEDMQDDTFEDEDDYNQTLSLLHCKPGEMEQCILNLLKEKDVLTTSIAQDTSLMKKENEKLKGEKLYSPKPTFTSSQVDLDSFSDDEDNIMHKKPQMEQIKDIRSVLDELSQQVSELSSSI